MSGDHDAQYYDDSPAPCRIDRGISSRRHRKLQHDGRGLAWATSAFIFHPRSAF
jgi:hypothetical protein